MEFKYVSERVGFVRWMDEETPSTENMKYLLSQIGIAATQRYSATVRRRFKRFVAPLDIVKVDGCFQLKERLVPTEATPFAFVRHEDSNDSSNSNDAAKRRRVGDDGTVVTLSEAQSIASDQCFEGFGDGNDDCVWNGSDALSASTNDPPESGTSAGLANSDEATCRFDQMLATTAKADSDVLLRALVDPYPLLAAYPDMSSTARKLVEEKLTVVNTASTKALKGMKTIKNAEEKEKKRVEHESLSMKEKAMHHIYRCLGTIKETATPDQSTYAAPTRSGLEDLYKLCQAHNVFDGINNGFLDLGSGLNIPAHCFAQLSDGRVFGYGIEACPHRCYLYYCNAAAMLRKPFMALNVGQVQGDILDLAYLPSGIGLLYCYDEVYPPKLQDRIIALLRNSDIPYYCTGKKKAADLAYIESKIDLERLEQIHVKKQGSNEGSLFTLYKVKEKRVTESTWRGRRDQRRAYWQTNGFEDEWENAPVTPSSKNKCLVETKMIIKAFERFKGGDLRDTIKMLSFFREATEMQLNVAKRRRKELHSRNKREQCLAASWTQCVRDCETCKKRFLDFSERVRVRKSNIEGKGIFASDDDIPSDACILEFKGKVVDKVTDTKTMLIFGEYVSARGLCKYVNQSCDPNAYFQRWKCRKGQERVSIVSLTPIKEGEEITVRYDASDEKAFFEKCLCPVCRLE